MTRKKGSGVSPSDIFRWERPSEAKRVEDGREGLSLCAKCLAAVEVVEERPGVWSQRDPDTGFPHRLTCPGKRSSELPDNHGNNK